jgi:hypothetical protein
MMKLIKILVVIALILAVLGVNAGAVADPKRPIKESISINSVGTSVVELNNSLVDGLYLFTNDDANTTFNMFFYGYFYPRGTYYQIYEVAPSYVRYNISGTQYLIGEGGSYWGGNDHEYDVTMHATNLGSDIAKAVIQENATNSPSESNNIEVTTELRLCGRSFTAYYTLKNIGSSELTNVKYYVYNDLDVGGNGSNFKDNVAYYDAATDTLYEVNPVNNYVSGFRPLLHSTHHNLSDYYFGQLDAISNDTLIDNTQYPLVGTADAGMVVEWDVGTLMPGQSITYPVVFGVSGNSVKDFMRSLSEPCTNPVPSLTPIGIVALAGVLGLVAIVTIRRRI